MSTKIPFFTRNLYSLYIVGRWIRSGVHMWITPTSLLSSQPLSVTTQPHKWEKYDQSLLTNIFSRIWWNYHYNARWNDKFRKRVVVSPQQKCLHNTVLPSTSHPLIFSCQQHLSNARRGTCATLQQTANAVNVQGLHSSGLRNSGIYPQEIFHISLTTAVPLRDNRLVVHPSAYMSIVVATADGDPHGELTELKPDTFPITILLTCPCLGSSLTLAAQRLRIWCADDWDSKPGSLEYESSSHLNPRYYWTAALPLVITALQYAN